MFLEKDFFKIQPADVGRIKFQKMEWRWVFIYAILLMVLMSVPYLVGFSSQTSTQRFGGAIIAIDDTNTYLAKMNQGAHGAWLFTLPYSSEPQKGAPIYWFYLLLGKLSGTGFISRVITFHLARIFFGILLILTSYRFLAEFLSEVNQRRLALIMVSIGGGLGWAMIIFGSAALQSPPPLEFYSPEAFSFLMLLIFPHLLFARSLLLFALQAFLHRQHTWAGLALVILSLVQPVDVIIVWVIIGLFSLLNLMSEKGFSRNIFWENLKPLLLTVGISAFPILYIGYLFISDPVLKQWSAQNIIVSPHVLHFISGYGPYLALVIPGLKLLKSYRPDLWKISLVWIFLLPILIYLPIGFQRRLIEGFQVPLVALAILGLSTLPYRRWLTIFILFMLIPSSLLLFIGAIGSASRAVEPAFQPKDELAAFEWLDQNAEAGQIVLSSYPTGNLLPVHTALIPFVGHGVETIFFDDKMPQVVSFYQAETTANERLDLIKTEKISYVFYGPEERKLGMLNPDSLPYLMKRFEYGHYSIYQVIRK